MKWWRKDKDGWPIEFIKGKSIYNFIRCIIQNLRKLKKVLRGSGGTPQKKTLVMK